MTQALAARALGVAMLLLAACQPVAPPPVAPSVAPRVAPTPSPLPRGSMEYGIHTFIWGHAATTQRDLQTAKSAGFTWQKSLFQWRLIEAEKGRYDWTEADRVVRASNEAGVRILARLDFQPRWTRKQDVHNGPPDDPRDFANFVSALVARYAPGSPNGELHAIEIWNEPNLQREWGAPINRASAGKYVELLKAGYNAAKAANPRILVVTAGLSPTGWDDDTARPDDTYLRWLYEAGMAGSYDVLGLHANSQAPDPLAEPGSLKDFAHPSFYFRRVEQLRAIQEQAGEGSKPVWILEFGWTSDRVHPQYSWFAVSEEQKGQNIVAAYRYASQRWNPWIGPMFLWTLPDPTWTQEREEYWWAIANPDGTPRPALTRILEARRTGELP